MSALPPLPDTHVISVAPEAEELSLTDLYDRVCIDEDIIITIDAIEEPRVRRGLSSIKAKRNAKLRENNLPTDDVTLEFVTHTSEELQKQHRVKLQIYMKRKPTITIHNLQVADGEL